MSLQVARALGVTLPSSSQYRLGEWAKRAAGVACVTRVFVTSPVALPVGVAQKMRPVTANWKKEHKNYEASANSLQHRRDSFLGAARDNLQAAYCPNVQKNYPRNRLWRPMGL
jgi:hypothetical protein